MKVIIAIDDNNGMMFNNRRQSSDVKLTEYISKLVRDEYLYMNEYSYKLFDNLTTCKILVDNNFLKVATNEYCFVEDTLISPYIHNINTVYICKWNRMYPSDMKLDINIKDNFKHISTVDILGKSHEKITIEEWVKN